MEADDAYAHATALAPKNALYWSNWAWSMQERGNLEDSKRLMAKSEALKNPN